MSFVARRVVTPYANEPAIVKLVWGAEEIGRWEDTAAYLGVVRRRAHAILGRARERARAERERAAACEAARRREADAALLTRAAELDASYQRERRSLHARFEAVLDEALAAALHKIAVSMPAEQRVRIVADALRAQVGDRHAATLYLSTADLAANEASRHAWPWPVEADATLRPGECRLRAGEADWVLSIDAFVDTMCGRR
ncbi:HrpE/YscL family type III secretion apparatus protein [Trinickia caryophylli]|uniref:Type III secretion protein L n=1 Tax=Trinickia caryophylli TaxID=28094 RepID=A0A1X7E058_TRICW|nr:HrpE/YscL family type III secretion apparatus protein [Trinickia caryophylli]PMS14103.1 hypothetical protein C0Z17_00755 [Trinickia caryophylli]TRX17802.1 hypothetical protein FNF07_05895 [Trinickia caryophylli]WQE11431.1 hypothetical protein U0034_17020 [Trinickia caryophylli]SMF24799.1 hypothetical protein SAMN06295900_104289 [Trinickia caryophylli]GLU32595.1 hypothetical protein Busp01_24370 [Trinickia caryophylli]